MRLRHTKAPSSAFGGRNPIHVGLASLAVITGLLALAYNADSLPLIGAGQRYQAEFSEAAGLRAGSEVRIAGVKVGKVTEVGLDGDHVLVTFRAKGADLGDTTSASIQIKTLLGEKFLALDPAGDTPLDPDTPIPRERTIAPYDVTQAFNQLSDTVDRLDTHALADSLRALSQTFQDTPDELRASLDGLSRLSITLAARDTQLAHLLHGTDQAAGMLAARNQDINSILSKATPLLDELQARQDAIGRLVRGTRELSTELRGLISDNQSRLNPTLDKLDRLTHLLENHQAALVESIRKFAPFATIFGNALGNGRWFDGYIDGLIPIPAPTSPQGR